MLKIWLLNRLNSQKWTGLSLTLLAIGFIYISLLLAGLGKWFIERSRPIEVLYYQSSYNFSSGHATIAIALYGFIAKVHIIGRKI